MVSRVIRTKNTFEVTLCPATDANQAMQGAVGGAIADIERLQGDYPFKLVGDHETIVHLEGCPKGGDYRFIVEVTCDDFEQGRAEFCRLLKRRLAIRVYPHSVRMVLIDRMSWDRYLS
jgi:hypothetical protein